jgi:hypothetical protein
LPDRVENRLALHGMPFPTGIEAQQLGGELLCRKMVLPG